MRIFRGLALVLLAVAAIGLATVPAAAKGKPAFGELYYAGHIVRTVVPPAAAPQEGVDPLYVIPDGAAGQKAVAAVAPGDPGYHGGRWAVSVVTWKVEPYLLTSAADVIAARDAGHVNVERNPAADFKCPIQP